MNQRQDSRVPAFPPGDAGDRARGSRGDYDAVVLAGGHARRLGGVHKPALHVGGRPVLHRVADAVAGAARLIIVGPEEGAPPRATIAREEPPGSGPVPALRAGLCHVRAPWMVLLAADVPFVRPADVDALRARARARNGAVLVDDQGKLQWLIGVWSTEALRSAVEAYRGDSLRGLLRPLRPAQWSPTVAPGTPPPWLDCDTMGDLESARKWN